MNIQDIAVAGGDPPADNTKPIIEPIIVEPVKPIAPVDTSVPVPVTTTAALSTVEKKEDKEANEFQSACAYCKMKMIAMLALDFSIVLMVLALSYHLLKRAKHVKA